jgi:hypothetical protein
MKKIAIFFFGPQIKQLYWEREDIVYFNEKGWWLIKDGTRKPISPAVLAKTSNEYPKTDPIELIQKLRGWGPIWSRWCGRGDQHELALREAALMVLQIASGLRILGIDACIMHTGVSHHVDSLIFEIASKISGVKLVFLYANVFSNRLLPLVQTDTIVSRKPLGIQVSSFDYRLIIRDFLATKIKGDLPKNNYIITKLNTNWYLALIYSIFTECKSIIRWILKLGRNMFRRDKVLASDLFNFASNSYFLQLSFQVIQQERSLKYLSRITKDVSHYRQIFDKQKVSLLIVAHYQPEATSFPEGWEMNNHIDIILKIREKGYRDSIFYKEHHASFLFFWGSQPLRGGMYRSRRYYEQLEQLECKFLDTTYKLSIDAQSNSWYLPVTITGSIAIERALAGFHTIVTGHPWFKGMPGMLPLSEIESLANIRPEWVRQDPELARRAFDFFDMLLSGKTITNVPGIATGAPLAEEKDKALFAKEFEALLSAVRGLNLNLN